MKQSNTCQIILMKPNPEFVKLPKSFWAAVKSVSQQCGYTVRGEGQVKVPTSDDIAAAFDALGLDRRALEAEVNGNPLLHLLGNYYRYRADTLNIEVEPLLMDAAQAKKAFEELKSQLKPKREIPLNKQKGTKKAPAYLTGMVNMIVEANCGGHPVDYDPRKLTTVTQNGLPLRTLSRRVDGAFPSPINPIAIWEIKEYYYTTTFGSRVADAVYETLLDGMEIEELNTSENIQVLHYLFLDARYTWWDCGKSYLCRIVDMVQMGYVDEVLVGKEVIDRLPVLVRRWVSSLS
jgi:hypothetical protein